MESRLDPVSTILVLGSTIISGADPTELIEFNISILPLVLYLGYPDHHSDLQSLLLSDTIKLFVLISLSW